MASSAAPAGFELSFHARAAPDLCLAGVGFAFGRLEQPSGAAYKLSGGSGGLRIVVYLKCEVSRFSPFFGLRGGGMADAAEPCAGCATHAPTPGRPGVHAWPVCRRSARPSASASSTFRLTPAFFAFFATAFRLWQDVRSRLVAPVAAGARAVTRAGRWGRVVGSAALFRGRVGRGSAESAKNGRKHRM